MDSTSILCPLWAQAPYPVKPGRHSFYLYDFLFQRTVLEYFVIGGDSAGIRFTAYVVIIVGSRDWVICHNALGLTTSPICATIAHH